MSWINNKGGDEKGSDSGDILYISDTKPLAKTVGGCREQIRVDLQYVNPRRQCVNHTRSFAFSIIPKSQVFKAENSGLSLLYQNQYFQGSLCVHFTILNK